MLTNKMDQLFAEIKEITEIEDIGYHEIKDGKLHPIYKSKTGGVSLEEWKMIHDKNPVFIKDDIILQEIITEKRTVVVSEVKVDNRSGSAFLLFGIDSIMVIPVIRNNEVIGIVPIVSMGKVHKFSKNESQRCEELVDRYKEFL